jgi:septal ring factor EnvC (AmiA/AmiB activator)
MFSIFNIFTNQKEQLEIVEKTEKKIKEDIDNFDEKWQKEFKKQEDNLAKIQKDFDELNKAIIAFEEYLKNNPKACEALNKYLAEKEKLM